MVQLLFLVPIVFSLGFVFGAMFATARRDREQLARARLLAELERFQYQYGSLAECDEETVEVQCADLLRLSALIQDDRTCQGDEALAHAERR